MNTHAGYSKKTLTDTNVLLTGGGDKSLADFLGGIQYVSASHKIQYRAADTNTWTDLVTLVMTDENVKQTPKTDNVNRPLMMINGGTSTGEQINTSMFSTGIYANASTKMITASGFIKTGSDDTYVLLGGGGHKAVSDFATSTHNHDGRYVIDAGSSITSKIYSIATKSVFSGHNLADAPVTGWVSGLVLGSNWNNNHYLHYLVESGSRWYATRSYADSKMKDWNTFAYLTDIKWSLLADKPSTFTPSSHTHPFSQITDGTSSSTNSGWSHILSNTYGGSLKSILYMCHGGGYGMHLRGYSTSASVYMLEIYNSSSQVFAIYGDGHSNFGGNVNAPNYYTTSDSSKKQNISSFSEHIRKFQLKDTEKWHYGVIAQEVPEIFRDGEEGNMTVNYNSVLSYYIGQLENRVKMLEDKLKKYEEIQNI